jgi:hypothetical protein
MLILFRKYILLQEFVLQIDDNIVILYNAFQGTILHKPNLKKLKIYMNPTKRSKTAKATSKPIKDLDSVCYYGLCAALTCLNLNSSEVCQVPGSTISRSLLAIS